MGIGFVEVIERDWLGRVLRDPNHSTVYMIGAIVEGDQEVTINFDK